MVTTRAMFRRSDKRDSVPSSSSPSNEVLQREAEVKLETELRIAAASFPPSPTPVFRADNTWSSLRMHASYGHPARISDRDIAPTSIPRGLRDPRLKAAMAKVLARVDGCPAHRVGVFKARTPPLITAVVASILHKLKVDNDFRRIPEGQEPPRVGTGPFSDARFEFKAGSKSDWFESEERAVAPQSKKCPFSSFDAPPRSSSLAVEDKDYAAVVMSHLIAIGEQARGGGRPRIDQRLLLEDYSLNNRITQRQRNPRRRDSEYAQAFQPAFGVDDGLLLGAMSMSTTLRDDHDPYGDHERSTGEHSSTRARLSVLVSPLVENNRVLLRKAIDLPSFSATLEIGSVGTLRLNDTLRFTTLNMSF
jgi:hypothetical protein